MSLESHIISSVKHALNEDLGQQFSDSIDASVDITANLIPETQIASATVITREEAVICGVGWVNEVFRQIDQQVTIKWFVKDGDLVTPHTVLCELAGNARVLLTGERTALNFLQTLSATATQTRKYVDLISAFETKLLDTRKTIPGMRLAQKYAVKCGGGDNHRIGLFDAYLIKENHIAACGGIKNAIAKAKSMSNKLVEIEVESIEELSQALSAGADVVMLDNFSISDISEAVRLNAGNAKLEVSGNISMQTIAAYAETGVDFISVGALTKNIHAIDLSMRIN